VKQPDVATILVGVVLVTVTIVSVSSCCCHGNGYIMMYQVILVERLGRKTLMLYGMGGMAVSFTLTTICFCFQVNHTQRICNDNQVIISTVLIVTTQLSISFNCGLNFFINNT